LSAWQEVAIIVLCYMCCRCRIESNLSIYTAAFTFWGWKLNIQERREPLMIDDRV